MIEQELFDLPRQVLGCWTRCPSDLGFLYQRFSSLLRDEAVCSETSKAERGQMWRPWFYPGLVAHSFFWLSERA